MNELRNLGDKLKGEIGSGVVLVVSALAADKVNMIAMATDDVVAKGDVTLNADFTGTIVAKGRIIVNKDQCEIDNGTQEVFKALLLEKVSDADDALHLYDVFMDGANYLGNVSSFSNKKEADTKIDYATLITYQNWTKE